MLVQQGADPLQHLRAVAFRCIIESLYGLERAAADKNREQAEEPLLLLREQVVAPRDGVAQRLLAYRQVPRSRRQEGQSML